MAPFSAPAALYYDDSQGTSFFRKIGFFALLTFIFLYISRIMDISLPRLHVPMLASCLAAGVAVLSGAWTRALRTRTAMLYLLMGSWLLLGVPFSVWRSGSLEVITQGWMRAVLLSVLVMSLTVTLKEATQLMNVIAFAVATAAVIGLMAGVSAGGNRLVFSEGAFANPNELAIVLVLGLPLLWRYVFSGSSGLVRVPAGLALLGLTAVSLLKTGSREGIVAIGAMLLMAILRVPLGAKVVVAMISVGLGVMAIVLLPSSLLHRYLTISAVDAREELGVAEQRIAESAAASTLQRRQNLRDSIRFTAQYPVFGVGPGNFAVKQNSVAVDIGRRKGSWVGTHNTYTQFSSECGIPVLIIFLVILTHNIRSLRSVSRAAQADPRATAAGIRRSAFMMELDMWTMCAVMAFAHLGYESLIYVVIGTATVFTRAARQELARAPAPSPAVGSMPATAWRVG